MCLSAIDPSFVQPLAQSAFVHDLSLYVHYPFCVHKCPYCDFASKALPQDAVRDHLYIDLLIKEWRAKLCLWAHTGRKLVSVYIGGGTPSLCASQEWGRLLAEVAPYLVPNAEISLEVNPGTVNETKLRELRTVGFNRLSIGVQSFNDRALKRLGRIHNGDEARCVCQAACKAGFTNFNIDLMHGLPQQDVNTALADLKEAESLDCTHLSWYELTIEEDTYFGAHPPVLPDEDTLLLIEKEGWEFLAQMGFEHYEVSGYNRGGAYRCRHNFNYWLYGDYLGIGCAAHQKLSFLKANIDPTKWGMFFQHLEQLNKLKPCVVPIIVDNMSANSNVAASSAKNNDVAAQGLYIITRSANPEDLAIYQQQCLQYEAKNLTTLNAQLMAAASVTNIEEPLQEQVGGMKVVAESDVPFEYMLNRLRLLQDKVSPLEYLCHTGLSLAQLHMQLLKLQQKRLIDLKSDLSFALTEQGKIMLNEALCVFLP